MPAANQTQLTAVDFVLELVCRTSAVEQASSYTLCVCNQFDRHNPALLHRPTLILDSLLTFLVAFFTLVLKLSCSQSIFLYSRLSLPRADFPE